MSTATDRANSIRTELLPILVEVDKRLFDDRDDGGSLALREMCFEWTDTLLFELQIEQAANERGACLEGLAAILER